MFASDFPKPMLIFPFVKKLCSLSLIVIVTPTMQDLERLRYQEQNTVHYPQHDHQP